MAHQIVVAGTSVKSLEGVDVTAGANQLGMPDSSGAVTMIIKDPKVGWLANKVPALRRDLFKVGGIVFIRTVPGGGLKVVNSHECPRIDDWMAYVVYTGAFAFEWVFRGFSTKGDVDEPILLEVVVRGKASLGSMDALLARTQQGLPVVFSTDWKAAQSKCHDPFAEILGIRTYAELKRTGLPGRAGVGPDSALCLELREAVAGILAKLKQEGNVFRFEDVAVAEVRPPEYIRKREEAQEALVIDINAAINSKADEKFWQIRSRISESAQRGSLDSETAARLLEMWEARVEAHLGASIKDTSDVAATRSIVEAAGISDDRKERLQKLLVAREANLKAQELKRRITNVERLIAVQKLDDAESVLEEFKLPDADSAKLRATIQKERERIKDEREALLVGSFKMRAQGCESLEALDAIQADAGSADIANLDRRKALAKMFVAVRSELERLALLEREQCPKHNEFAAQVPDADRGELALLSLQLERSEFVPTLKRSLEALIAARDQELRDETEARIQAEVEERLKEVDVQARVVIAANARPEVRGRLDTAAALLNGEKTRTQAAIALLAASASDRGVRDGFLADAAALLGGERERPALEAASPRDSAPDAVASGGQNGRKPPEPRANRHAGVARPGRNK